MSRLRREGEFEASVAAALLAAILPCAALADADAPCTGYIDSVPANITSPGRWCLRADLDTTMASGVAVHASAANVQLDCEGHTLRNTAAGNNASGIGAFGEISASVRNCRVDGFNTGISLNGSYGLVVAGNVVSNARHTGISLSGGSTARVGDNRIYDVGGAEQSAGLRVRGDAMRVQDNIIDGVHPIPFVPDDGDEDPYFRGGIVANDARDGRFERNIIRDITHDGERIAGAVKFNWSQSSRGVRITDNVFFAGVACTTVPPMDAEWPYFSRYRNVSVGVDQPDIDWTPTGYCATSFQNQSFAVPP